MAATYMIDVDVLVRLFLINTCRPTAQGLVVFCENRVEREKVRDRRQKETVFSMAWTIFFADRPGAATALREYRLVCIAITI